MLLSEQITLMSYQNHFCLDNVLAYFYCLFQALMMTLKLLIADLTDDAVYKNLLTKMEKTLHVHFDGVACYVYAS